MHVPAASLIAKDLLLPERGECSFFTASTAEAFTRACGAKALPENFNPGTCGMHAPRVSTGSPVDLHARCPRERPC